MEKEQNVRLVLLEENQNCYNRNFFKKALVIKFIEAFYIYIDSFYGKTIQCSSIMYSSFLNQNIFMKNLVIVLFLAFLSINIKAQTALESKITDVTVFKQNAEVTRKVNTKLLPGKQEIILTGISTYINPASLQVQIAGAPNVTLLSAKYERNYLLPVKNNPEIEKLKARLDKLAEETAWIKEQKSIYKGMEEVMNLSKSLNTSESGFNPNQVSEMATIYKTRLFEIRKAVFDLKKEDKKIVEERNNINAQLNEINALFNKPSGNIVLQVSSVSPATANFKCSYIVSNAGWSPVYDLRSEGIEKDVVLNYKANIYQNTGQKWNDVNMTVSTGNPAINNDRPILNPLYANYYVANYNADKKYKAGYNEKAVMNMMYAETNEEIVEDFKDAFQYNAQSTENQMSVMFKITHKQTVATDGKMNMIPLESYNLPTEYIYHAVPKLDKGAFLLAKVSDWGKYNLVSGDANIFFDGGYVGKSFINGNVTSDTLLISMGRDESINIQRKQKTEFCEVKFLGSNKKETLAYEISVKNKKSIPIEIEILDQIPVSQTKDIVIELLEKGTAVYTKDYGKLLWRFELGSGQSKKLDFSYSAKFPKDQLISGIK